LLLGGASFFLEPLGLNLPPPLFYCVLQLDRIQPSLALPLTLPDLALAPGLALSVLVLSCWPYPLRGTCRTPARGEGRSGGRGCFGGVGDRERPRAVIKSTWTVTMNEQCHLPRAFDEIQEHCASRLGAIYRNDLRARGRLEQLNADLAPLLLAAEEARSLCGTGFQNAQPEAERTGWGLVQRSRALSEGEAETPMNGDGPHGHPALRHTERPPFKI
jgi:hypothetical protein